jgi:hypothetical protein
MEEAARVQTQLLALAPQLTLKSARVQCALDLPAERDHYMEGLRKAGLS